MVLLILFCVLLPIVLYQKLSFDPHEPSLGANPLPRTSAGLRRHSASSDVPVSTSSLGASCVFFPGRLFFPPAYPRQCCPQLNCGVSEVSILMGGPRGCQPFLQVSKDADEKTIKKQYRRLSMLYHPDKNRTEAARVQYTHPGPVGLALPWRRPCGGVPNLP